MTAARHLVNVEATEAAGAALAAHLEDGAIVGIDGPLGAGKTSFTRGLAMALGVPPHAIASPSFTLVMEHELPDGRMLRHVDAWRLHGCDELSSLGWEEWAGAKGTVTVVEWASRIEPALGADVIRIDLDYDGSGRVLSMAAPFDGEPLSGEMP
jgi:tRNA threonylcarbamoyladenosine biosynthesis protein TsaE